MEKEALINHAKRIMKNHVDQSRLAEGLEFLRIYAGEKSSFYQQLQKVQPSWLHSADFVVGTLEAFVRFIENGLVDGISIERKAQIDVVSDFLEQAQTLLDLKEVHPAAPCVLIGASLEEFMRNWIEEQGIKLGNNKPSLDAYAKLLREKDLITKQDHKDITSWGGLRNHAAHGEWDEVHDKKRIFLMMEGVNLFMRKYGK